MASEGTRVLDDFTSALHRLIDSDFNDARDNIIRLLAIIRASPDLAELIATAPNHPPFKKMALSNHLMHHSLRLPPEPEEELGVAMQMLSTIEVENIPFNNYVWEPDRYPRDVLRKYIAPAMERLRRELAAKVAARHDRESRFEKIVLEDHQKALLTTLVEASRNVPHSDRQPFRLTKYVNEGVALRHLGLTDGKMAVYEVDLEMLAREGLVAQVGAKGVFDVTPKGYQYYTYLCERSGQPSERIASSITAYLRSLEFERRHRVAHAKWLQADKKLWETDSQAQLTEVGHVCREALQEFAQSMVDRRGVSGDTEKPQTIERIRKVLGTCDHFEETERAFVDALLVFWGTVNDLAQRQEHGAAKEGSELVWEDARRLVFHTAVVMYEIDKAVERVHETSGTSAI